MKANENRSHDAQSQRLGEQTESQSAGMSLAPPAFNLSASPIQQKANAPAAPSGPDASGGGVMSEMEESFGEDFSNVNIKTNSQQAVQMNAQAFAQGNEVHFAPGKSDFSSQSGKALLGHELTHVVQQRKGSVPTTGQVAGQGINDDPKLEQEADQMGELAARGETVQAKMSTSGSGVQLKSEVVQRVISLDDAKKQIEKAAKGWGTDESAIYDAIRNVSPGDRALLAADAGIQATLKSELGGHDYFKAQLLLHYGSESAFPDAIKAIWKGTKGWGTDEKAIFRALQKLSAADAAIIKAVPGVMDMIKSEMSGKDLTTATELLDGDYAQAIQNHKDNVAFAKTQFQAMRTSGNTMEENTAEWMEPQVAGAAPKNELYILTKTHDSEARAKHHGEKNHWAYFGDGVQYPSDNADYEAEISSKKGLKIRKKGVQGSHLGVKIWVMEPKAMGAARFKEVIIHEVQHDADRHDDELGHEQSFKHPEESWNRYKTEFRAYWMDGNRTGLSDAPGSAAAPWDNARQKAIYDHMMATGYKDWLDPHMTKNPDVYGTPFVDLVHGYTRPEGVNLTNSPRIDNFYLQLKNCSITDTDLTKDPLKKLETEANALDANDKTQMNTADALRLQEMMKDHLEAGTVLPHFAKLVNNGVLPGWVNVNIAEERKAIVEAGSGWGTDENKIYSTIENASAAERIQMKRDSQIRKVLFEELGGHDLYKALFMLEFGAVASWPSAVKDLFDATKGWGTDEAKIRTALEKLTRPQMEAIAGMEGLKDMLHADLSGQDKTTVDELLSGDYADAIANREADMAAVDAVIQAGLAGADVAWADLCKKLVDPKQAWIYAMTSTHDAVKRATKAGKTGKQAYFGADQAYPNRSAKYDSQISSVAHIRFVTAGTNSETAGKTLYIYEARNIAGAALKTILETFANTLP